MLRNIPILVQLEWKKFIRFAAFILMALSLGSSFVPTRAQQPEQRTFASAEDAGRAIFTAMQGAGRSLSVEHPRTRRKRFRLCAAMRCDRYQPSRPNTRRCIRRPTNRVTFRSVL